jgi:hypothetical protein
MSLQGEPLIAAANDDVVEVWDKKRNEVINSLGPSALSFITTDGAVSMQLWRGDEIIKRIGHNRGVWPGKIIKGSGKRPKEDPAKRTHQSYAFPARRKFSLWFRTRAARDQIAKPAEALIKKVAERDGGLDELPDNFSDLGPEPNFEILELELLAVARDRGVFCWDDVEFIAFLDRVAARADEIAATSRGGRYSPIEVALAKELGKGNAK